ncbi:phosphoadenylyl-sulfate reductase [Brytella acorum]|uniref:Adenosine 5'-phosphosulfate reductase n=1 Tax=Brytella acorum TaxID=2959299 RepID=A0AA35UYQ9_9PROT|nr:phosphoadenylyl-sulfate reductase [Brytella acorum]MDF3625178.1 phosphoadenylyl-sulfate reductase [Brytella acorum]CAI9122064.1 phosphoadenylyl-sulfate reductase [Brytella acorum]
MIRATKQAQVEASMALSSDERRQLERLDATELMGVSLTLLRGRIALVSSFGTESALLLALAADVDPTVPVLFLDTGQHFPETLAYRATLSDRLGLSDVRSISPTPATLASRDPTDQLWYYDADACCALRKVEPLDSVLPPFDAWISGRKRSQASTRAELPLIEAQPGGQLKINPLASWTPRAIEDEITRRGLPRHPLMAQGYLSIGCAPCTRPVEADEDPRAGRWAGMQKTECGIHKPLAVPTNA